MTLRYLLPFRPPTNFDEVNADLYTLIDNMEKTIEGAKDHSQLTGVTADQHHAKLHQAAHQQGGADANAGTHAINVTGNADTVDSAHLFGLVADLLGYSSKLTRGIIESGSISATGWYTTPFSYGSGYTPVAIVITPLNTGTGNIDVGKWRGQNINTANGTIDIVFYVENVGSAGTTKFGWVVIV